MSFKGGRRGEQRRKADWAVKTGQADAKRRPMSPAEVGALVDAARGKRLSEFGVVKLSGLRLDDPISDPAPWAQHGRIPITLLTFAAALPKRDAVVGALLRAGSDPSVHPRWTDDSSEGGNGGAVTMTGVTGVREWAAQLQPSYTAWLAQQVVHARRAGIAAMLPEPDIARTVTSEDVVDDAGPEVLREDAATKLDRSPFYTEWECQACHNSMRQQCPLAWTDCSHIVCDECFWGVARGRSNADGGMPCPADTGDGVCGARLDRHVEGDCTRLPGSSPDEVKRSSMERFLELPEESTAKGRLKFAALTLYDTERTCVGTCRSYRSAALHKAAASGRLVRLAALINVGVDVDARNEYGQTALFVCAWQGMPECVRLLVQAGADVAARDAAGTTPREAALAEGHLETAELLAASAGVACTGDRSVAVGSAGAESRRGDTACGGAGSSPTTSPVPPAGIKVTEVVPRDSDHPGAGAVYIDGGFSPAFLERLDDLHMRLPTAEPEKGSCSVRSYYCDATGWVRRAIAGALRSAGIGGDEDSDVLDGRAALPQMRFLHYSEPGGDLPPHIDLCRTDLRGRRSTKTFILYTQDCDEGGETAFLQRVPACNDPPERIAAVQPRRGRLLVFPHVSPHEGCATISVPKVLLRGEVY